MSEPEAGERVRRLTAGMRFLSEMHSIGSEADLIDAVLQAAAVWYDLDARAYRRDLSGRDRLEMWLPGTELEADPRELTAGALVSPEQATHISSMADFEQIGWHNAQAEVVLVPIAPRGRIRWTLVVPGAIDRDTEAMLTLVCRTAASVLDKLDSEDARGLNSRLAESLAQANAAVAPVADAVLAELMAATGAVRGTLAIRRRAADKVSVLAARGDVGRAGPEFDVFAGQPRLAPERLALALGLGGRAEATVDLGSGPTTPFTVRAAALAEAGVPLIGAWLTGLAAAERRAPVSERTEVSSAPLIEQPLREEVARARRLELKGGVVVMSLEARNTADTIQLRRTLIQALKAEIRSADLLGQLASGEYAALLVRANESGIRSAERRLRERIERLSREQGLPKVTLGTALYPPATGETLGMLLERARAAATLAEGPRFFG
jgi:hypothetical protein